MTKFLIRGARVLDLDGDTDMPPVKDILIEGDRIRAVTPHLHLVEEHTRDADII